MHNPNNQPDRQRPYRVGRKNARNIYAVALDSLDYGEDEHIGVMFNPDDGPMAVEALNATYAIAEGETE